MIQAEGTRTVCYLGGIVSSLVTLDGGSQGFMGQNFTWGTCFQFCISKWTQACILSSTKVIVMRCSASHAEKHGSSDYLEMKPKGHPEPGGDGFLY